MATVINRGAAPAAAEVPAHPGGAASARVRPAGPAPQGQGSRPSRALLLVGNFLSGSRTTRWVCEELADRLSAQGWPVLTTSRWESRLFRLCDMVATVWLQRRHYQVAQLDVYSGRSFLWAELIGDLLWRAGKPCVLTLHGGNLPAFARRWPRRVRRLLRQAAVVTTPSCYLWQELRPYRADLQLLPNAIELGHYRFQPRSQPRPRLLWLRAFHEIYHPSLAPQVVAALAPEFPELHLTMIGPDRKDGSLAATRHVADTLGVADRITFVGGVLKKDIPDHLNQADLFLNTTSVDNTPISLLEAMASGLCVVSTDVGGIPYLLTHGHDALLVPPAQPALMAAAVRRVLREPGLAGALSAQARVKVEQFDWTRILPQWDALFERLMPRAPEVTR